MHTKLYFAFALMFGLSSFSQEISGTYCTNSKYKNNAEIVKNCFVFNPDFTFEEISIHHNVWLVKGTYEIKKNLIIVRYHDPLFKDTEFKFKIIKNKGNDLIIKDLTSKTKYILEKTKEI